MSWLRLDDGFATNPKIAQLTDKEFRVWIAVLCYCAAQHDPSVDRITIRVVNGLTLRQIRTYIRVGLLDEVGNDYVVHDWEKYAPKDPTGALRQAKWRANRNGDRNGESNGLRNASDRYAERYETVTSRVRPRARPVPSRNKTPTPNPAVDAEDRQRVQDVLDGQSLLKDIPF